MAISRANFTSDLRAKNRISLPKPLLEGVDDDAFSLAIDCNELAVVEITNCCGKKKVDRSIQRIIDLANTYTEYVPQSNGIRMIGYCDGSSLTFDSIIDTVYVDGRERMTLSIFRRCDMRIGVSGIPLLECHFSDLDPTIDELVARTRNYIYLFQ